MPTVITWKAVTTHSWTILTTTRTCWLLLAAGWFWSSFLQLSLHSAYVSASELIVQAVDYNFISFNSILSTHSPAHHIFVFHTFVFSIHLLGVFFTLPPFTDFSFRISSVNSKWISHLLYLCNGLNCFNYWLRWKVDFFLKIDRSSNFSGWIFRGPSWFWS